MIQWLQTAPLWQAILVLLAENLFVFFLAVLLGHLAVRRFAARRVALPAPPLQRLEIIVAGSSVLLNTVTTLVGLFLWRWQIIRFRTDTGVWAWLDVAALLLIMDLAMYVLHRLAHHPWIFPLMHRMHHDYDKPRPLTLFILNPVENLSFGILWLAVICVYQASWLGMSVYLGLNVFFGTVGHLGVEPLPSWWSKTPLLRNLAGSTFHARHHQDLSCNFGFYTLIWDRLLGTLRRDYWESVGELPAWVVEESRRSSAMAGQAEHLRPQYGHSQEICNEPEA
jgi:sterol desaturase/sphingolipid hydroxylase (fatty acid hydroxylase superfamily)